MRVEVQKLTDEGLLKKAMQHTFGIDTKANLKKWYKSEHSPIRTQMFALFCYDIPYSVVMQMRTHDKNGALFLVESGRPDGYGSDRVKAQVGNYRDQPRNMTIICNAQHLIDWSHKRLCMKAEYPTRLFMALVKDTIKAYDLALAEMMVARCDYIGRCTEFFPCGKLK